MMLEPVRQAISPEDRAEIDKAYNAWRMKTLTLVQWWRICITVVVLGSLIGFATTGSIEALWIKALWFLLLSVCWLSNIRRLARMECEVRDLPLLENISYFDNHRPVSNAVHHARRIFQVNLGVHGLVMITLLLFMVLLLLTEANATEVYHLSRVGVMHALLWLPTGILSDSDEALLAVSPPAKDDEPNAGAQPT